MISTVFNASTVYILNDDWNGASDFELNGSLIRDEQLSLTRRSARRPYAQTLVSKCKFQVTLEDEDVRLAIASLRAITTEKVILPFWPAISTWANRAAAPVSGGLRIVWKKDWSQFAIYASTDAEPGWPAADDLFAPALMGFLTPTQPQMLTPDAARWDIEFTESSDSAYALGFTGAAAAAGPQPAGYASGPKLLPLQPDFQKVTEEISVEVKREQIGFTRDQSTTFYPQAAERRQDATYTLTDGDVWGMMQFFVEVMGPGASFWASAWLEAGRVTGNIGSGDSVFTVDTEKGISVGDYLSFYVGSAPVATAKVTGIAPQNVTISAPLGVDLTASETLLFQLCLVRLPQPTISLKWKRPGAATCELQWEEAPAEYAIASDETLGGTIGELPIRVVLLQFTRDLGNGTVQQFYFTSFEKTLTYGGQDYTAANFQVGDIAKGLNLEEDTFEITSFIFSGNPLNDELALASEAPLTVTVKYADYDGTSLSNVQTVFTGDAAAPSRRGNRITVKCNFGPAIFETQLPRMIRGVMCNWIGGSNNDGSFLVSAGCTLLKADWKFTALVAAPVSDAFPFSLAVNTLTGVGTNAAAAITASAVFANFFANGWIEWGAGAAVQRRMLIGSTAPAAGALTLTLHRYFGSLPNVGDTVTFYPGCDGLPATCKAYDATSNPTGKFNNYVNFGGEPFTPIANPSTSGQPNLNTQGGKK